MYVWENKSLVQQMELKGKIVLLARRKVVHTYLFIDIIQ